MITGGGLMMMMTGGGTVMMTVKTTGGLGMIKRMTKKTQRKFL